MLEQLTFQVKMYGTKIIELYNVLDEHITEAGDRKDQSLSELGSFGERILPSIGGKPSDQSEGGQVSER